ncbi:MAG TPA: thioredoxin family protein [Burkholderiales bacterium]|nr:thioredoxin family protein [Burkholderiales bacterium]
MRKVAARALSLAGALILAWAFAAPGAGAAEIGTAADLSADLRQARERGVPLVVLFSLPGCGYCERVRREFLHPLQSSPEWRDRVILRQVDLNSPLALADFAGRMTTHGKFATEQQIRLAPTVKVFDPAGREAAEPLVGLLTPELYGLYLERALEQGLARARPAAAWGPR